MDRYPDDVHQQSTEQAKPFKMGKGANKKLWMMSWDMWKTRCINLLRFYEPFGENSSLLISRFERLDNFRGFLSLSQGGKGQSIFCEKSANFNECPDYINIFLTSIFSFNSMILNIKNSPRKTQRDFANRFFNKALDVLKTLLKAY